MTRPTLLLLCAVLAACSGPEPSDGPTDGTDTDEVTEEEWATVQLSEQLTTVEFEGFKTHYWAPENPKGLCFVFHGSNSTVDAVLQIEWLELFNELIDRDIAFAMTSSTDRPDGKWDHFEADPALNDDFPRLSGIRDLLIAETGVSEATSIASLGFSGGASMANFFGGLALDSGWDFRVFSMHNSTGYSRAIAADGVFVSAEHDPTGQPDALEANTQTCIGAGNRCVHFEGREIALHPLRFTKSTYYGRDASQFMFDDLVDLGFIDEQGWRRSEITIDTNEAVDAEIARYERETIASSPFEAGQQLRVVWATHRLTAEFKKAETDFMLEALTR